MDFLNWLVVVTVQASRYEKPSTRIIAAFEYPFQAEEFINKCLPPERKNDFKIVNVEDFKQ